MKMNSVYLVLRFGVGFLLFFCHSSAFFGYLPGYLNPGDNWQQDQHVTEIKLKQARLIHI